MKRVRRLDREPPGLRKYRDAIKREEQSWEEFRSHEEGKSYTELAEVLEQQQRGLCGYCEIDIEVTDRQIEHVVPQSDPAMGSAMALDYRNMIACCKGGTRWPGDTNRRLDPVRDNQSCGQAKGSAVDAQFLDPRTLPALPSVIRVLYGGEIEPDLNACRQTGIPSERVQCTIDMLGLNAERLRRARGNRWNALNDNWAEHVADAQLMREAARAELLPNAKNRLSKFFSTSRSYFDKPGEQILCAAPNAWI